MKPAQSDLTLDTHVTAKEPVPDRILYIVVLKRDLAQKRVFLEGDDTDEAQNRLRELAQAMPLLASSSADWLHFLQEAYRRFLEAGFLRTAH